MRARANKIRMDRATDPSEIYENDLAGVEGENQPVTMVRFPAKPG